MLNSVVAKMYVSAINIYGDLSAPMNASSVAHFNAVYSPDPENPNHQWSKFTPSGTVKARRTGPLSPFDVGRTYKVYLVQQEEAKDDCLFVSELTRWDNKGCDPGITVKLKTRNNDYGKDWNEVELSITNPACFESFEMGMYFKLTTMPCEITEG